MNISCRIWVSEEILLYILPKKRLSNKNEAEWPRFLLSITFPGQWFDKETGLFHNGFRYYNANVGRYTQSVPLGLDVGSRNLEGFVIQLLKFAFVVTRVFIFILIYLTPIICFWLLSDAQDFFKFALNLNFFVNSLLILFSLVFSNFISLKIFRKIEKIMELDV